eukprot:10951216-Lingulodinium_polyedra.AAC.1
MEGCRGGLSAQGRIPCHVCGGIRSCGSPWVPGRRPRGGGSAGTPRAGPRGWGTRNHRGAQ